jgi:hypothetical protein
MWTSLALLSALSWTPAQAGQLELKNARFTYGFLGQERKDSTFLPGDMAILAFDIEGLKVDKKGQVKYSTSMELFDHQQKKPVFKTTRPQEKALVNTLGGSRVPAIALTNIGTETKPGDYTMTVVVTDLVAKTPPIKLERKFQVKPAAFGIVRPGFVYAGLSDEEAGVPTTLAPPLAVPGQNLILHFSVGGFKLAGQNNDPDVEVRMVVQDDKGKPVLGEPYSGEAKNVRKEIKDQGFIPFQIPIQVNRSGKFKIVLTAKDKHAGKTDTLTLDLRVVEVE